jgi:hypothetical protein
MAETSMDSKLIIIQFSGLCLNISSTSEVWNTLKSEIPYNYKCLCLLSCEGRYKYVSCKVH